MVPNPAGAEFINQGKITADFESGLFELDSSFGSFFNSGRIVVSNGDTMSVIVGAANIANVGSVTVNGNNSLLTLETDWQVANATIMNGGLISVGSGATMTILASNFTNTDDITISGNNSILDFESNGSATTSFTNSGSIAISDSGIATITYTTITNSGTISVDGNGSVLSLYGDWSSTGSIVDTGGTLNLGGTFTTASLDSIIDSGGQINISGALENSGNTVSVGAGSPFASLNLEGGTISGGTINETGDGLNILGGTLSAVIFEGTLKVGAGVTLSDSGTQIGTLDNAGTLNVSGGNLVVDGAVSSTGSLDVTSGNLLDLSEGGTFAAVTNNGTIDAASGLASFSAAISGTGTLEVDSPGRLWLMQGASAGQTVDFAADIGKLDLSNPLDFLGSITDFGSHDKIDLLKTPETGYNYFDGVLTVMDGNATVASLQFAGNYTTANFTLVSDQHGGTLITWQI